MYWETEDRAVRTQDPGTIREVLRYGLNIYPLISLDVQIINATRQNATVTLVEKMNIYPEFEDVAKAGHNKNIVTPPVHSKHEFIKYLALLKQHRWSSIKLLGVDRQEKLDLLKGKNDSLTDDDLFQLARNIHGETMNINFTQKNPKRLGEVFNLYQPKTRTPDGRRAMFETPAENRFLLACKPDPSCDSSPKSPFWRDSFDFDSRNQHVTYKLAVKAAQTEWKKERQELKDLNVHLPVGIEFQTWKAEQEALKRNDIRPNYQRILQSLDLLIEHHTIPDMDMGDRIQKEEERLQNQIKSNLEQLWRLQKEKRVLADGDLFDMKMVNPRCLAYINQLLANPKPEPTVIIRSVPDDPQLSIENPTDKIISNSSDWTDEWSSDNLSS